MATVTIDGSDHEATPLSPVQLLQWQVFIARLSRRRFWADLMEEVDPLPVSLAAQVVARSSPPATLNRVRYFELAFRVESAQYLVNMTCRSSCPEVTDNNAADIYLALEPLILNKPVVLSGGEGLAKMREAADA